MKLGKSISISQVSCVPSICEVNSCFVGDLAKTNVQQVCYVSVLTVLLKGMIREAAELYSQRWTNIMFWNVLTDKKKKQCKKEWKQNLKECQS